MQRQVIQLSVDHATAERLKTAAIAETAKRQRPTNVQDLLRELVAEFLKQECINGNLQKGDQ